MNNGIQKEKTTKDYIDIPLDELEAIDVSDKRMDKIASGYFLGKTAVGRRSDIRRVLEDKVINKIGNKGKYLTDKLFELVEGVHVTASIKDQGVKGQQVKYYKVPPNLQAIIYCIDRVLGKPKQMTIQANFSLSKLLIDDGKSGQTNNGTIQARPDLFHSGDVETNSASSQEGA